MALSRELVLEQLKNVIDPELNVNIVDLGLVYNVDLIGTGDIKVEMTLTTQGCPMREYMEESVPQALQGVDGVSGVEVEIVWDPPWTPEKISPEGLSQLGRR